MTVLSVARDFSRYPGGRFKRISQNSGEEFRERLLEPAVKTGKITIDLDGVRGYGSSFLEEVFGGLVRTMNWKSRDEVDACLEVSASEKSLLLEVSQYINDALGRIDDVSVPRTKH